jgi:outer membrane protein assembly factor BamB
MKLPTAWPVVLALVVAAAPSAAQEKGEARWPQFRGPGGQGVAADQASYPSELGPAKNLLWKVPLPLGQSSPCIWGDHIFLTGYSKEANHLETICLDRRRGTVRWRRAAAAKQIERTHKISSPAAPTAATDGERVYVYFGSFGLLCYDFEGKELWTLPLPLPQTRFGTGSSPIVVSDRVLLNCEFPPTPYLLAVNARTGTVAWKKERLLPSEGYATPLHRSVPGGDEIILHLPTRLLACDLKDGGERWWVRLDSVGFGTPVVGDGRIYVNSWYMGGDPDDRVDIPPFAELLKKHDTDKDGKVSRAEFPRDLYLVKRAQASDLPGANFKAIDYFGGIDKNKDGQVDAKEWEGMLEAAGKFAGIGKKVENGLLAVAPAGKGDITGQVVWREKQAVPEVPSPLFYRGRVYLVKDGGIVTCVDAATGKVKYRQRLSAAGSYFSSPVAADGKIYAASRQGTVTVFAAGDSFTALSQLDLDEPIMATPALVDGKVYLRTDVHLYAFGD